MTFQPDQKDIDNVAVTLSLREKKRNGLPQILSGVEIEQAKIIFAEDADACIQSLIASRTSRGLSF